VTEHPARAGSETSAWTEPANFPVRWPPMARDSAELASPWSSVSTAAENIST